MKFPVESEIEISLSFYKYNYLPGFNFAFSKIALKGLKVFLLVTLNDDWDLCQANGLFQTLLVAQELDSKRIYL